MDGAEEAAERAVAEAFRTSWGRVIAAAFGVNGDLGLAEEAAAESFSAAVGSWRSAGVPRSVEAWLVTAARRRAIDQVRRIQTARAHEGDLLPAAAMLEVPDPELDELRFLALCAGDDLPPEQQVIMVLRFGCGFTTETLATMFHVPRATMAARLTRAKHRLQAEIGGNGTLDADVPALLPLIDRAVYLIFTAGTNPATGQDHTDADRLLHADFLSATVHRRWPHTDSAALRIMITLAAEPGPETLGPALRLTRHVDEVTPLSTQAAIAIEHALARTGRERNWLRIAELYDVLLTLQPNPTFAVGRAVALSHAFGPEVGLADLDDLVGVPPLQSYRFLHAARGDCLRRLGRDLEADAAYARAAELSTNSAQRAYFAGRSHQ